MKVFSGNSNVGFAQSLAKHLKLELSPLEIFLFPDKEKRIRINTKVLGEDCIIVQSTSTPTDENYMELFLIIDALKRSGAKSVKAVIPYLGYQRQDHIFRQGEGVSLEVIAEILQKVGMTELFSFDLHTPKIKDKFIVPVKHLSALPAFAEKIKTDFKRENIILVSPDMGGIRRIKEISEILQNVPFATITKNRDLNTGKINDSFLDGYVRGKTAVIVDDMVSTGETLVDGSKLLLEEGATSVFAFITHAVLARDASEILQSSGIERVFVSDTISIPKHKEFAKLSILSVAKVAAKAIKERIGYSV